MPRWRFRPLKAMLWISFTGLAGSAAYVLWIPDLEAWDGRDDLPPTD